MRDRLLRLTLVGIGLFMLSGVAVRADARAETPAEDPDRAQNLESEVAELRGEVTDLKQMVDDLLAERRRERVVVDASADVGGWRGLPDLAIGGFSEVSYAVVESDQGTDNFFRLGDLDLFLTSQLSDQVFFLAEILFEFEERRAAIIDVERLILKYEFSDWLRAAFGRSHIPNGYWNTHYHHGGWLQTTVRRPLLFEFEDEGGILPSHSVGIELSGDVETDLGFIHYVGNVGNGRGDLIDEIQVRDDMNSNKMTSMLLAFRPEAVPGLRVGGNVLLDKIPQGPPSLGRTDSIRELIAGGHLVYLADPYELLVEGQVIRHRTAGATHLSSGGYAQLAYRFGKLKPYYRFDWLEVDSRDPYFTEVAEAVDTRRHTFGVRFDWTAFAALKFEYERQLSSTRDTNSAIGNISFAF